VRRRASTAWIGAAIVCLASTQVLAQQGSLLPFFKPTMEDVAPGVDHGNSDKRLPEDLQRQAVFYRSQHPAGTIVIETSERHLYLIESETRALRYGIGVGRDGFTWAGLLQITRKTEWPDWHPPPERLRASLICPALWQRALVIRWALARCIWETPFTASTAPTRRRLSATQFRPAVFV